MVLNNTKQDIKVLLAKDGTAQNDIAVRMGVTKQYISNLIAKSFIVSKPFVALLEAMGYDIRLEYVKRE